MNVLDEIRRLRAGIRLHRDQRGDDRCWLDDWRLWKLLPETVLDDTRVPADATARCEAFYRHRRADVADPVPADAIIDPARWDDDLAGADGATLNVELARLRGAIADHRDVEDRERTLDDDRALYAVLPEKIPADFRLPPEPEFLGEARAPTAGCPAFLRSHGTCPGTCHNLHRWGPCDETKNAHPA